MRLGLPSTVRSLRPLLLGAIVVSLSPVSAAAEATSGWLTIPYEQVSLGTAPFVIDVVGRRAYFVGGLHDGVPTALVHESDLDAPKVDWQAVDWGAGPEPRVRAKTVLDPVTRRLFYVGGSTPFGYPMRDVWLRDLAGGTWLLLATGFNSLPIARIDRDEPLLLDTRRERLYVLQGRGTSPGELFTFDLATGIWSQPQPANAPAFGAGAFAAYDSLGDRILLLGGAAVDGADPGLTHVLDVATMTWSVSAAPSCPLPVREPRAGFDPLTRRLVVAHATAPDQWATLEVDAPTTWTTSGGPTGPLTRWTFDPIRGEMHATDGGIAGERLSVVATRANFALSLRVPLHSAGPVFVGGPAHVIDPVTGHWYFHGGRGTTAGDCAYAANPCALGNVWRLPLAGPARFQPVDAAGEGPGPLGFHTAVLDSAARRIVFHGGVDAVGVTRGESWALSLDGHPTWSIIETSPGGPLLSGHAATMDASRRWMYVVGGWDGTEFNREVWKLDLSTSPATWSTLGVTMPALAPGEAVVGFDRHRARLLVLAGRHMTLPVEAVALEVDLAAPAVLAFEARSLWDVRSAYDTARHRIVQTGGINYCGCNSVYFYNTRTRIFRGTPDPTLHELTDAEALGFAPGPLAAYDRTGDRMLLIGSSFRELRFDASTPARMDLVEAEPGDGGIRVRFVGEGWSGDVNVERTEAAHDAWERIGTAVEITPGTVEFVDRTAVPGREYLYRGRFTDETGESVTSPSAAVSIPGAAGSLALRARDGVVGQGWPVVFECRLPTAGSARLELYDVAGRVVARAAPAGVPGEWRSVSLAPSRGGAGLYFARLVHGGEAVTMRVVRL
jgi:hypothetical protein